MSNCSGSSWRSGAQAPYRSRLGWSAGAFRHVLSSHTGSFLLYLVGELRSPPFYLIKSLCNCTSAAPMSSVPSVKRSTSHLLLWWSPSALESEGLAVTWKALSRAQCTTTIMVVVMMTRKRGCKAKATKATASGAAEFWPRSLWVWLARPFHGSKDVDGLKSTSPRP